MEAGLAAGMQVVMVPHHKVSRSHLLPATQVRQEDILSSAASMIFTYIQVLSTLADYGPEDFGLPPFTRFK